MSGRSWMVLAGAIAMAGGCGGGSSSSSSTGASSSSGSSESSGGQTASSAGDGGTAAGGDGATAGQRRSGLSLHIENMHAGGNLVSEADPQIDRLDVSFDLQLNHSGTEPLTG